MRNVLRHRFTPYLSVAVVLTASIVCGTIFGSPVWASWIDNPTPVGFESAIIYDTVLIPKDPALTPVGIPYVGWAVGKLAPTGGAVIFYYNGSTWSRVFSDPNMGALKSVDARYSGTTSTVVAVGDFTRETGTTVKPTANYNTILYGQNNVFSIQAFQGSAVAPTPCNVITQGGCQSWMGSVANPVGLTGVAFTDDAIISPHDGGVCDDEDLATDFGFYVVGQQGTFLVGKPCYENDTFRMFAMANENNPATAYYGNLFTAPNPDISAVTQDYTTLTDTGEHTYFIGAVQSAGVEPRLFKFSTWPENFGLREVNISGSALDNRVITNINATQKAGTAGSPLGNPWQLVMATETAGAPAADIVYAEVAGDATTPLFTDVLTRISTGGVPMNAVATSVTYRGGEMVVNGDFEGQNEIKSYVPNGWRVTGGMTNFDNVTRQMAEVVNNPTPGVGASGKVLRLATDLFVSEDAAIRFYTTNTMTQEAIEADDAIVGIEGPADWDANSLLTTNTANGKAFRISGFFETTGLAAYDFRLSYHNTAQARLYVGDALNTSAADFTTPKVNGWTIGSQTASGTVTFTSASGAEILDSSSLGTGSGTGIMRAGKRYPFVIEYAHTGTASNRRLKLEWKPQGAPVGQWQTMNWRFDTGNNQLKKGAGQQSFATQILEQTRGGKGPVYRVRGQYRVAKAPEAFFNLNKLDPRKPLRGWGGLALRCSGKVGFIECGLKWDLFIDPKVESDTLSTDSTTGGWRSFDFLLAKTTNDEELALGIVPLTEYGTVAWYDNISVEPYQETALASAPRYKVVGVSSTGKILEGEGENPATIVMRETKQYSSSLETIDIIAPNKGVIAGADGLLVELIPGFVRGWGWVGTTTNSNSNDALGWISFSCADVNLCNEHQLTYGVDVLDALPATTTHPFAGAAWFGTTDTNQTRIITGNVIKKDNYCTGDSSYICTHALDPNKFCSDRSLGTCGAVSQQYACSGALSFSDCSVECSAHPFGCSSVGWLSFERNTDPVLSTGRPPAAPYDTANSAPGSDLTYTATFDETTSEVRGWARFLTLRKASGSEDENTVTNGGWVKFQGPQTTVAGPLTDCEACALSGGAISCDICSQETDGDFAFCTGATSCTGRCENNPSATCPNSSACPDSECLPFGKCSGNGATCVDNSQCPSGQTCGNRSYECASPSPPSGPAKTCYQWGTAVNQETGNFVGWAWSEDVGWVDMSRVRIGEQPWFQTLQGNIFSAKDVGDTTNQNPIGSCNATYRITAVGQLVNVCSSAQSSFPSSPYEQEGSENLILPSSGLETVFGTVNLKDILADDNGDYQPPVSTTTGRYGQIIFLNIGTALTDFTTQLYGTGLVLDKKIYYHLGDFQLDGGLIRNAPAGRSGNGLLVINGDLTITDNIRYQKSTVSTLDQLASLGVIVLGDLHITSSVEEMVGAYYAPGNPLFGQSNDTIGHAGGSIFVEGGQSTATQLVHQGLLIGKEFVFERKFGGFLTSPEPAERIIYDGRVVANPPPGFTTLQKALPIVRQIVP